MKKWAFLGLALLLGYSLLLSQDLVEAAKKEKERRARLKKKSAIVVTNADLASRRVDQAQDSRRTTPQTSQKAIPSKSTPSQKRVPAQQIDNIDQIDLSVDKTEQLDQLQARGFRTDYATQVLNANEFVKNPESALDKPDGKFAEISFYGVIDLEISTINGPGEDIAIYATYTGAEEMKPGGEEEGGIPELAVAYEYWEGFWYGILGMEETGEWVAIGQGRGTKSPEKFDLGNLQYVKKLRIMFKPHSNADLPFKIETWQTNEFFFEIDAVESLHR